MIRHKNWTSRRYRYDLLWELTHMIMEAEMSYDPSGAGEWGKLVVEFSLSPKT